MRPSEDIMRMVSDSPGISMLKTATGFMDLIATFSAMFIAKLVLPIEGRPAMTMRSAGCRPEVISSRSLKPVETPVIGSSRSYSSSMRFTALVSRLLIGTKPALSRDFCCAISKTFCSALSSSSGTRRPSGR